MQKRRSPDFKRANRAGTKRPYEPPEIIEDEIFEREALEQTGKQVDPCAPVGQS